MNGDLPGAYATWNRATTLWPVERRDAAFARFYSTRSPMSYWAGDYEDCVRMGRGARAGLEASMLEARSRARATWAWRSSGCATEEGIEWLEKSIALGSDWEEHAFRFTSRSMNMRAGALRFPRGRAAPAPRTSRPSSWRSGPASRPPPSRRGSTRLRGPDEW